MDYGLACIAQIAPGKIGYSSPLGYGQAEIYEDGIRRIYEFDVHDLPKFHDWVRRIYIDNARRGPLDLEISNNGLTIHVVEV